MANHNLAAYYRLGDPVGSFSVQDSSGNGQMGSLVPGTNGTPVYGVAGVMLYDSNAALDCTAGQNTLNGGFSTIDSTTNPPVIHQPLGSVSGWMFESWIKWTSTSNTTPGQVGTFTGNIASGAALITSVSSFNGNPPSAGDAITGPNIPTNTVITGFQGFPLPGIIISQAATGSDSGSTFTITGGAVGSTIFSAASVAGVGGAVDIRVGAHTVGSGSVAVTSYNRLTFGPYVGGAYTVDGVSTSAVNLLDQSWHHVAFGYSGGVGSIYIDGAFDSSSNTSGSYANPQNITIGCDAGPLNGWVGAMQDVALYSSPISAAQIANHYNTGKWFQLQEYGASVGGTAAGRFNKLMALEGLDPTNMLNVPYPFRTLMYAETNSVTTTSGLNYLQTLSETEPGLIFQGPDGRINAYSRQYQYLAPNATTSQAIFGDSNAASVQYHYDGPSFQLVQDDLDTWNNIQVQSGRQGSVLQTWSPIQSAALATSASVNGRRTLQGLTSLQQANDSDALAIAQQYAAWYGTPVRRVTSIMTDSYGNQGQNIPQILQRGLYDRMTIQYQGQTPGPQFSQDSLIESISHSVNIANGPVWTVQWQMSPYELTNTPFIFGASVGSASNQLAGAASVTGSGTAWILHPAPNNYLSGTVSLTVAAGTTSVAYNASAAQVQAALVALVPSTTCTGGPLNTSTVNVTFGSSQGTFTSYFSPSNSLTL